MGDFFAFRRMLAPLLIHIIFWVGALGSLALGGAILAGAFDTVNMVAKNMPAGFAQNVRDAGDNFKYYLGIGIIIFGPLLFRLICELWMLPFRINGTLTDIRNTLMTEQEKAQMPVSRRGM